MARDIVVVGASAGGVEAITLLVSRLPTDLQAAVFAVLHVSPTYTSILPRILARATPLAVSHPVDGEVIQRGHIYVAPPDHHLLLTREGTIGLSRGPRENRSRPAVDPLFRTAALAYGARVIGVVLSGSLGDGTAGLQVIEELGGLAIVQDPEEAAYGGMPRSAIQQVDVDYVLPVVGIADVLVDLVNQPAPMAQGTAEEGAQAQPGTEQVDDSFETVVRQRLLERADLQDADLTAGNGAAAFVAPVPLACPECGGTLWDVRYAGVQQYRCQVGHRFSADALLFAQSEKLEAALWVAIRALEEQAAMLVREGRQDIARRYEEQADLLRGQADTVRSVAEASAVPTPGAEEALPPTG